MADSDKLGLGLDDLIRLDRTSNRGGRGGGGNRGFRGRGGGGGRGRGGNNGFRTRGGGGIPRTSNAQGGGRWKHDLFGNNSNGNRVAQRSTGLNSTTKLLISNLDFGVTTNDIEELFADVGAVRVARVHYDESGRSLGTAEVIFERRVDAVAAEKKYNTLNLDGRPMDIKLVGGSDNGTRPQSNRFSSANGGGGGGGGRNQRPGNRNNNQQNGVRERDRRQQQNGTGGKKEAVSAEDLDADLDAYRAESKQKKAAE